MDVFKAFPNAVVSDVWQIGRLERNTEEGVRFISLGAKDVIVDEAAGGSYEASPQAAALETGTLLYAKAEQMPTMNPAALISDYLWENTEEGQIYAIIEAGIGKNQDTGVIEHVEFRISPKEVIDGE